MSDLEFLIPKNIPVWEIVVIMCAAFAMLLVFILWYFFGYELVVLPSGPSVMNSV